MLAAIVLSLGWMVRHFALDTNLVEIGGVTSKSTPDWMRTGRCSKQESARRSCRLQSKAGVASLPCCHTAGLTARQKDALK